MLKIESKFFRSLSIGNLFFCLGIIFLPSALTIGGLFLLIALVISISKTKYLIFSDKWNYPLFLSTGLIIISCIKNSIFPSISNFSDWKISSIWLNLINWIPLFLCFWGFQEFLKNETKRTIFVYSLLIGTIPVLFSCITQYWFNWYGPFETLNGLIIWFQKPLTSDNVISGLFSNPNITGFWLSSVFPFSLAIFLKRIKFELKSFFFFLNTFCIFYLTILTGSRNALIGLFSSFPFLISFKITFLFLLILFSLLIILTIFIPAINSGFGWQLKLIPYRLLDKFFFNEFGNVLNYPRLDIYSKAISFISQKPLLGWGGSTFAFLYLLNKEAPIEAQHAHNLSLQIAFDFGLPLSIILTSMILILFIKALKSIIPMRKEDKNYIDKALLASSFIGIFFHLFDVPYYDARVSILTWTLFSALKCILDEKKSVPS